jgi:hypothetical protein
MNALRQIIGMMGGHAGEYTFTDSDAADYYTALGMAKDGTIYFPSTGQQRTGAQIAAAIDAHVIALKADSLWTPAVSILPIIGGSAATHKWNLKDPDDDDASHRATFHGTVTHSEGGMQGNGTTGYCNTYVNESTHLSQDSGTIAIYSRTDANNGGCDIGVRDTGDFGNSRIFSRNGGNFIGHYTVNSTVDSAATGDSLGFFLVSRTDGAGFRKQKNGTNQNVTRSSWTAKNLNYYVMAGNYSGTASAFSSRQISYVYIGAGLSEAAAQDLQSHVETLQDALGRGVV